MSLSINKFKSNESIVTVSACFLPAHIVLDGSWSWLLAKRKAAMMAFCKVRVICNVSILFFINCDWVRAKINHGNELECVKFCLRSFWTSKWSYKVLNKCILVSTLACFVLSTKCRSSRLGREPLMRRNQCPYTSARTYRIYRSTRRLTGQYLKCLLAWKKRKNV